MRKLGSRYLIFSIASIVLWIASALLLAVGISHMSEWKLIQFIIVVIFSALLGYLGFRLKLRSFSERIKKNQNDEQNSN